MSSISSEMFSLSVHMRRTVYSMPGGCVRLCLHVKFVNFHDVRIQQLARAITDVDMNISGRSWAT